MAELEIIPRETGLGAEVAGLNIAAGVNDDDFAQLKSAFIDHGLLFFRDQDITPEQHIAFAERWAPINVNRFFTAVADYPQIAEVRKEPEQTQNIGGDWHTDHSYDIIPAMGSILLARETPPVGGDTLFSCMYKAYETLSPGLQKTLRGMKAVHSSRHVFGDLSPYAKEMEERLGNSFMALQDAVHPVIINHPESGRPALYVNPAFTTHFDGWTVEESKPLLTYLYQHAAREEHTTRFNWAPGSIAFWDNRCTWHNALNDYQGHRRVMHRITLEGSEISGF